jgi:hypothetical protein
MGARKLKGGDSFLLPPLQSSSYLPLGCAWYTCAVSSSDTGAIALGAPAGKSGISALLLAMMKKTNAVSTRMLFAFTDFIAPKRGFGF